MNPKAIPPVLLLAFLFGTTLVASRYAIQEFHPVTYVGFRLGLAGLGFLFVYVFSFQGRKPPTDHRLWRRGVLLGFFDPGIPITLVMFSLKYQSSGLTSILIAVGPAITVLLAHFFLPGEELTRKKAAGICLAFTGASLLALRGESGLSRIEASTPVGFLLVMTANVSVSTMTVFIRRSMVEFDPFDVTAIRILAAASIVLPVSFALGEIDLGHVTWQGCLVVVYAALAGTFVAFLLAIRIIRQFGATPAAFSNYLVPVVASIAGAAVLNEKITFWMLVSMVIILGGLGLLSGRKESRQTVG